MDSDINYLVFLLFTIAYFSLVSHFVTLIPVSSQLIITSLTTSFKNNFKILLEITNGI
ncbi:hypothetical protein FLJC2902T_22160 [Flavobacterium limnosediminis JC2902]|uniref:Uncharacterized protein n=1 Tax=Flavobacterium limnosediminis JC2902 TaxID=1341181 RepID=V6SK64_9FLAO|nr:hypothetical protein FLJC2902T_22160 [Flavobacterium limnosediminis JC2902]